MVYFSMKVLLVREKILFTCRLCIENGRRTDGRNERRMNKAVVLEFGNPVRYRDLFSVIFSRTRFTAHSMWIMVRKQQCRPTRLRVEIR